MSTGFRLPLAARLFVGTAIMVAVAVALAAFVTLQQGKRSGAGAVVQSLAAADAAQQRLEALAFEKLDIVARTLANDASFARYVAEATDDGLGLGVAPDGDYDDFQDMDEDGVDGVDAAAVPAPAVPPPPRAAVDSASVKDLLAEQMDSYQFGFGMVLDSAGTLVARTDEREAFQQSFGEDPFFGPVVDNVEPATGYWRDGIVLYQAAARPIAVQGELVGYLVVAAAVDRATAMQVREVSGGEVAYWLLDGEDLRLISSSVPEEDTAALRTALAPHADTVRARLREGKGLERVDLALGERHYAARLAPLFGQIESPVGGVLTLSSIDAAMAPFTSIRNAVLLGGVVALVLALAVSLLLARRVLLPVAELAEAAEQAASGNYQQQVSAQGNDELARLSRAFDSLLSDLREKRDIEGYVGHLSRFLPDPGGDVVESAPRITPRPATRRVATLVGLELRRFLKAPPAGEEAITLTALGQLIEEAHTRVQAAGGELLEQEGPRLLFGFGGDAPELRALSAINAWWQGRIGTSANGPAAAVVNGEIVHGSLPARPEATATIGLPVLQVERLLAETPVGAVLLSPVVGEAIKAAGLVAALRAATGQSSGKRFLAIDKNGLLEVSKQAPALAQATVPVGGHDVATQVPGSGQHGSGGATRLAMGSRFAGRYEILAVLGAGGMGMVYKARDTELNDVVALKMLRPGLMIDAETLEQLKVELKLARKITHPNVLRTFDFGEAGGVPYISMEYVRGLTLRYLLQQAGRLPFSAALRIARQLCMGLDAAHQVGVVHRDIKPENIIIEQSGNAKLMDFGIAKPARRVDVGDTEPGSFVGTPAYASPEQLGGAPLDQRSDIYSTGVMLCEMFCGKLPFSGGTTVELYVAHLQQPPLKPSVLWPDIPKALEEVILKCLEKKADARYASAADLLVALSGLRA